MNSVLDALASAPDLLLVIIGFGFIVFIHELGHFLAARWAGIRVLAFAIGFGPAVASFRKGLGLRFGSSEKEAAQALRAAGDAPAPRGAISPTEYRLNLLPFGGYVKMLGQVDADPGAVSDAPDSYQNTLPWKRMVVISAGVIANLIGAAVLFMIVFLIGLPEEPPRIGAVIPGSPAARAQLLNADAPGVREPGLQSGDVILSINAETPQTFNDVILGVAMSRKDEPVTLEVAREGAPTLTFRVTPEENRVSGLLDIGIEAPKSATILPAANARAREAGREVLAKLDLPGVEPGMTLVRAGSDTAIRSAQDLADALNAADGAPVPATFRGADGKEVTVTLRPRPALQAGLIPRGGKAAVAIDHLLGLTPVMSVREASPRAKDQGLRDGDLFVRIGGVEYPNMAQGRAEIQAHKGGTLPIVVARRGDDGALHEVSLPGVSVSSEGQIGFGMGDWSDHDTVLSLPPRSLLDLAHRRGAEAEFQPAGVSLITTPGTRIASVNGVPVRSLADVRAALRAATVTQYAAWKQDGVSDPSRLRVDVEVELIKPIAGALEPPGPSSKAVWTLGSSDVLELHALGWESPALAAFQPERFILKASGPIDALRMGLWRTHRVMTSTYLTFARLAQGSVKVEHLKGPVGIAHLGTMVAEQGGMKLLFFLALISVNLAVINFLPLPIVDGGQFLFLVYEQVRGRPPSIAFQNVATLAGLVLIASVFLVVTYHDLKNLLGF